MIETISIAEVATYGTTPEVLSGLSNFNYIYGSNGTGKTTISRVIADYLSHPKCSIGWKNGTQLEAMVYNRDFVESNFSLSTDLKGVFTIGEQHGDTLQQIATTKSEITELSKQLETLTNTLKGEDGVSGKLEELSALNSEFKQKCWAQKQKHDAKLQGAFEGLRGDSEKFKARVISELASNNTQLMPLIDLEKKAESLFGIKPTAEIEFTLIDTVLLLNYEASTILKKVVIGKNNVDIAAIISKLGNSDWVRQGRVFYDANDNVCPFCQQATNEAFAESLNEYFDETYAADISAIDQLLVNYKTETERRQQQLVAIISSNSKFLDGDKLRIEKELFDARVLINLQRLADKKKEPSQAIALEPLSNVLKTINDLLETANTLIANHNKLIENLAEEKSKLTTMIWRFVLEELKLDITAYTTKNQGLIKAIESINEKIATTTSDKTTKNTHLRSLEKQITSIQPTIDGINYLLNSFGFRGFLLAPAANGNQYKLIRPDGTDAKATLSEGEKTFITFLYFYYLLKGSDSESGTTNDRIVVFDDPVSSLDSDILFIVGNLIKGLMDEVRLGNSYIKQIFVLTHNVYFHKEVTFNTKRSNGAMTEETFWVVRKAGLESRLERHLTNPIRTSYDLLWQEVKNPNSSNLTIQNTLRRILENYFKFFGGIDPKDVCNKFTGQDKLVCNSLLSWVNDGSHYAQDDLYTTIDHTAVQVHLNVFKGIFEKSGHLAHYIMMMGIEVPEPSIEVVA